MVSVNPKYLAIAGTVFMFLGIILGWYGFPAMIRGQIGSFLALKEGSEIRQMWTKFPEPLDFEIYMFNVTNPMEIQNGAKPVVQEVGPFFYDEYKEKTNLKDREKDDTVEYKPKVTWYFNKEKSLPLTGNEVLTVPNAFLLVLALTVEREMPGMMSLINKAMKTLFQNPESVFITAPAKDILFDGLVINCNLTDFAGKAICTNIKENADSLERVTEDIFKFSFFGLQNGSINEKALFRVKRGIENIADVGRVVEFNGKKNLENWSGKPCNKITGTDSTIFPPFLDKDEPLTSFSPELCRSLDAIYQRAAVYKGVVVGRYTADLGDMSTNPDEKCFCPREDYCLKKGAFELSRCQGAPIVLTLPHFYNTDKSYLDTVIGVHPDVEKHQIFLDIEMMTAMPVQARRRLQFNIPIHSIAKINLMKSLPDSLIPIFWIGEGLALEDKYIDPLKTGLLRALNIMYAIQWGFIVIGGGMIIGATALYFYRKSSAAADGNPDATGQVNKAMSVSTLDGNTDQRY